MPLLDKSNLMSVKLTFFSPSSGSRLGEDSYWTDRQSPIGEFETVQGRFMDNQLFLIPDILDRDGSKNHTDLLVDVPAGAVLLMQCVVQSTGGEYSRLILPRGTFIAKAL